MNARENVVAELAYVVGKAQAEGMMRAALSEHAHELAEEARQEMGPVDLGTPVPESDYVMRYVYGWHSALNRIDPPEAKL